MNTVTGRFFGIRFLIVALILAASLPLAAQDQSQPDQSAPPQPESKSSPLKPMPPAEGSHKEAPATEGNPNDEVKITPRQAEELFHSVDEIMQFDSRETGLPIKREIKRKLTSRDEVVSYLTKHLNDE